MPRGALAVTFKSEWVARCGGTWRVLPERGRAVLGCGVGGCRYHRPASFEDRPFHGVLVGRDFHHPFSFLKGDGAGDAWTTVRGNATMGTEGAGEGAAVAKMGAGGAEAPAAPGALGRLVRALASLAHFSLFNTMPA